MTTRVGVTGHQSLAKRLRDQGAKQSEAEAWRWAEQIFGDALRDDTMVLSSLATGADQRLALIALDRGARIGVLVPSDRYADTFPEQDDLERYLTLLARASEVTRLGYSEPSEEAYFAAGKYIVDHSDLVVAVWDGQLAEGLGGTGDIVAHARLRGKPVLHLDPIRLVVTHLPAKE